MPVTLAHAAVVPPLARLSRGHLVVSALVAGSVAPDFPSIVYLNSDRTLGHALSGQLNFCLPVGLAVLVVWHRLLKRPLASLLPPRMAPVTAVVAQPFSFGPLPRFLAVCLSVLAGSVSHVTWDAFTHSDGFFVRKIQLLDQPVHWQGLAVYEVLQYASGMFGVALLGWWWHRWMQAPRQGAAATAVPLAPPRLRWMVLSAMALASLAVGLANALRAGAHDAGLRVVLGHAVLGTMAGCALAAVAAGALLSRWRF